MTATNTNCRFAVRDIEVVKKKMLNWVNRFSIFCLLDNHGYQSAYHSEECLLAAGCRSSFNAEEGRALQGLQEFINGKQRMLFGHLGYELKNEIEALSSIKKNKLSFPAAFFFEPEIIIRLSSTEMEIDTADEINGSEIFEAIMKEDDVLATTNTQALDIRQRVSKEEYINTIQQLQKHILRGDCYEINYCMEFFAEDAAADPLAVYQKLSAASPNPFSALYKLKDKWLICASPERFLKKEGKKILSQPIKGTSTRVLQNENKDAENRQYLFTSEKDRSENVMVVDLVRNDLAKVCKEGTVKVDELFGIYSFPQVHQMISTVSGELKDDISFAEIIKATFPMGSMTGAPKRKVMELIDRYERSARGIFSGAVGYINNNGDFDFNVVIRSIMYNASEKYLSFMAGSGITFYSDAEKEYDECLLKAEAMRGALLR